MRKPADLFIIITSFVAMGISGCASTKVKKLDERTYEISCKTSTDACQSKAWELCGGDFDTIGEDFKETTTETWHANPSGQGSMMVKRTDVDNNIKIRCVDK